MKKVVFGVDFDGTVVGHRDGHGFIQRDDGEADVYLSPDEMRSIMHRDRVRARCIRQDHKGRPEGKVLDILERPRRPVIGRLLLEGGVWLVAPEDRRTGPDILVPKNAVADARAGQVVVVELTEPPSLHAQPVGRVVEVLGEVDDPGMEIEIAVRKFEVPHRFSPETLAQAAALPERLRAIDLKGRIDLTDVPLVTIDGEDARDFDDAVYCEPHRSGRGQNAFKGWRLLVAIADVSHYVRPGTPLDTDAYARATSVYFPRRVIPMLPEKLSNGLCSLNPDVMRLALVCDMLVDEAGQTSAYQFYPAVMKSRARLTYTEVAAALLNTRGPEAGRLAPVLPHLLDLHAVYRVLLKARKVRGAVDFETTETQIVCDASGRIERIVPRVRTEAHRLIEEAMLAANVCAADFIAGAEHPALYRVHEGPTPEKRAALQAYLKALGAGLSVSDDPKPAEFQALAEATKDRVDAQQVHAILLRSMQQAIYGPANSGHFGLAYEAYTHFTSPIRRYPDLLIHRVIKALLQGKRYRLAPPQVPSATPSRTRPLPSVGGGPVDVWAGAGLHCSANERRADEASRDVEAWLKCRYMRERLGEEFAGVVTSVAGFGVFVTLDSLHVEGLVHITELGGEYFRYDDLRQELRGERTGQRFAVGTRVQVQVCRVDLDGRRIDFRIIPAADAESPVVGRARSGDTRPDVGGASAVDVLAEVQARDRAVKRAAKAIRASQAPGGKPARKTRKAGPVSPRSSKKPRTL